MSLAVCPTQSVSSRQHPPEQRQARSPSASVRGRQDQLGEFVEHGVRNTGRAPLRFLYVFAADAIGDVTYQFSGDRDARKAGSAAG
jgi:hypothetical protein